MATHRNNVSKLSDPEIFWVWKVGCWTQVLIRNYIVKEHLVMGRDIHGGFEFPNTSDILRNSVIITVENFTVKEMLHGVDLESSNFLFHHFFWLRIFEGEESSGTKLKGLRAAPRILLVKNFSWLYVSNDSFMRVSLLWIRILDNILRGRS